MLSNPGASMDSGANVLLPQIEAPLLLTAALLQGARIPNILRVLRSAPFSVFKNPPLRAQREPPGFGLEATGFPSNSPFSPVDRLRLWTGGSLLDSQGLSRSKRKRRDRKDGPRRTASECYDHASHSAAKTHSKLGPPLTIAMVSSADPPHPFDNVHNVFRLIRTVVLACDSAALFGRDLVLIDDPLEGGSGCGLGGPGLRRRAGAFTRG